MMRSSTLALALVCMVAMGAVTKGAHADVQAQAPVPIEASATERAAAEALFTEGKRLMAEGKIADACRAFAESQRLDAAGGTLFALAFCHEQEKKTASAWLEFKEALVIARRDGRRDREVLALEHIAALEPRLARVTLRVHASAPYLEIRLDGAVIGEAAWSSGTALPVDPGAHALEARAPGMTTWSRGFDVREGSNQTIDVPPLVPDPASRGESAASHDSTSAAHQTKETPERGRGQRMVGYAIGGAGLAILGVGAAFGVRALVLKNKSDAGCDAQTCDAASLSDYRDSRSAAHIANVGVGVGLGLIAGGVVVLLTAPHGESVRVSPVVQRDGSALMLSTRF